MDQRAVSRFRAEHAILESFWIAPYAPEGALGHPSPLPVRAEHAFRAAGHARAKERHGDGGAGVGDLGMIDCPANQGARAQRSYEPKWQQGVRVAANAL